MGIREYLNPPPTGIAGYAARPDVGGIRAMAKSAEQSHHKTIDAQYQNPDGSFKGGFAGAVKYFMHEGYSKEAATKIAGKIAAEQHGG